jgi:putative transposase
MLRIRAALQREQGMVVNKKLILSIMRELGIKGLPGPKKRVKNLVNQATEEDLVKRNFTVDRPDALWLTDITEHPTREGKVYCCVVLDAFSRRIVGWAIDRRCETALVNDAVMMASESRPTTPGSIIHSDHGPQGGFKRPSQHLETEVLVWVFESGSVRFSCIGARSPRRVARRWRGARIVSDSGPRLPKDFPLRMLPPRPRCRRPSASDGSATLVAWDRTFLQPCQVVTCRSLSARTSLCGVRKMSVSVRSLAD